MRVLATVLAGCALLASAGCGAKRHAAAQPPPPSSTAAESPVTQQAVCPSQQGAGIAANFGHRRTMASAETLLAHAESVGFQSLVVQQRACADYAVVLPGLPNRRVARALQLEAKRAGFPVTVECRSSAVEGELAAVFGHRRTRRAAIALREQVQGQGFQNLNVVQDRCDDWEVNLYGIKTPAQRHEFRAEARRAGFRVTFEPG